MSHVFALDLALASDAEDPKLAEAPNLEAAVLNLSPSQREAIYRQSGIPRAKYAAFASSLGVLAARGALAQTPVPKESLAVMTVGWRQHIPIAWDFAVRAQQSGAGLVNPVQFPHTLPSSCATSIAAGICSHGPAFGIESELNSTTSAVTLANDLIGAGFCDNVIVVIVSDGSHFTDWELAPWGQWPDSFDCAFAVLVGAEVTSQVLSARTPQALDRLIDHLRHSAQEEAR